MPNATSCPMSENLNSDIFLRIMKLPADLRRDVLEFLGQSSLTEEDMDTLLLQIEQDHAAPIRQFG